MKTLEYNVPLWNKRFNSPQDDVLREGYFRCLTDMGIALRAEVMPSGGKGAQARRVQIDLEDETKETIIDSTMKGSYNATPI